jgi:hypothetical protein
VRSSHPRYGDVLWGSVQNGLESSSSPHVLNISFYTKQTVKLHYAYPFRHSEAKNLMESDDQDLSLLPPELTVTLPYSISYDNCYPDRLAVYHFLRQVPKVEQGDSHIARGKV